MRKILSKMLFGLVLCVVCFAGSGGTKAQAAPKLNKKSATITVGQTVKLKVKGTKKKVKWSSTNKAVCTVNKSGLVKGKKAGSAVIKAKVKKKTLKCKVTVKAKSGSSQPKPTPTPTPKPTPAPSPTGLRVTGPYSILAPGGTMQLTLGYVPTNAKKEAVEWYSSNRDRATVSSTGLVTAKKEGEVTITAELKSNDDIRASFKFRIQELEAWGDVESENGGDLLLSDNSSKAVFEYTISFTTPNVQTQVLDGIGNVVRTWSMGTLGAEKPAKVVWDLKRANGTKVPAGSYCFQIVAAGAKIKSSYFTVYAKSDFDAGNGSSESPYEVSTLEQLKLVGSHNGVCFKQTANIDANFTEITPLFTADVPFVGIYDGFNYSITNIINSDSADYYAVFRAIGEKGIVRNLNFEKCNFTGNRYVGLITGYNRGTISNCTVKDCIVTSQDIYAGCICGVSDGTIKSCNFSNNVVISQGKSWWRGNYNGSNSYDSFSGTVCGWNEGVITQCKSSQDNIRALGNCVGGIAGYNKGTISNCEVNKGTLSGDSNIGGIVGNNYGIVTGCEVDDSENHISAGYCGLGGIIGWNCGTNANNIYYGKLSQSGRNHWD